MFGINSTQEKGKREASEDSKKNRDAIPLYLQELS